MKQPQLFNITGIVAIVGALMLGTGFAMLGKFFGYPDIIREGSSVLLTSLHEKKAFVPYLYYLVGLGGVALIFFSVLFKRIIEVNGQKSVLADMGMISGIICGVLLYIGIQRYFVLFPFLAEQYVNHSANPETIDLVFQSFSKYVGFTVTEHSMFNFLCLMVIFFSTAMIKSGVFGKWLGYIGIVFACMLLYGSLEVINVPLGFLINRIASKCIIGWLLGVGVSLVVAKPNYLLKSTA